MLLGVITHILQTIRKIVYKLAAWNVYRLSPRDECGGRILLGDDIGGAVHHAAAHGVQVYWSLRSNSTSCYTRA